MTRDPLLLAALLIAIVCVVSLVELLSFRKTARMLASRGPYNARPAFTVDRSPEWDVVVGAQEDVREVLLERCREMDAGAGGAR